MIRAEDRFTARCNRELMIPQIAGPAPPPAPIAATTAASPAPDESGPPGELAPPVATEQAEHETIVIETDSTIVGRLPRSRKSHAVHWLAAAMAALALLSVVPIIVAQQQNLPQQTSPVLERWAVAILLLAILHLVYMLYLIQLPDWSCVWVVSLFLLLVTTLYATLLGIRLLAPTGNQIMQSLELDGNLFSTSQEAGWCFLMVVTTGVTSYWAGRLGTRWYRRSRQTLEGATTPSG